MVDITALYWFNLGEHRGRSCKLQAEAGTASYTVASTDWIKIKSPIAQSSVFYFSYGGFAAN
jgi:hypothetical protein